jgi:EamA domain-containing membrane protein RarD
MIGAHIDLILIITGAVTAIALLQFIAPAPVLRMIFGKAPTDDVIGACSLF